VFRPLNIRHVEPPKLNEAETCSSKIHSLHLIWGIILPSKSVTMENHFIESSFENTVHEYCAPEIYFCKIGIAEDTFDEIRRLMSGLSKISLGKIDVVKRVAFPFIDSSQGRSPQVR